MTGSKGCGYALVVYGFCAHPSSEVAREPCKRRRWHYKRFTANLNSKVGRQRRNRFNSIISYIIIIMLYRRVVRTFHTFQWLRLLIIIYHHQLSVPTYSILFAKLIPRCFFVSGRNVYCRNLHRALNFFNLCCSCTGKPRTVVIIRVFFSENHLRVWSTECDDT